MALNPEDLSGGFQHYTVMAFINEKMAKHVKGPEFYLENTFLSWAEVEDKLRDILEDSGMPSEAKDACTWSCLALGMRFAHRQSQAHACRMQRLHDFNKLHKSAAQTLASNLRELSVQQDMDRKEVAYNLRLTQAKLEEVERERDMLRWKLFQAEVKLFSEQEWIKEGPGLATASETATGAGACTPPRPAAAFTATSPYSEPFDGTPRSDVGTQGKGPQEPGRGRAAEPQLQRRLPAFRMPGDWDCPWCKAVNFSQREICFRCGGEIWLQKP
ncbi:PREDICTED: testis-expressed sequence 13B protein [Hipposideros armiger]|uniref:Testis-expressed sequence 13B protein n=1 Tax=Hipposideros armiger TaxID=186990 RepID=A0A8B7SYV0_HIPAR|nr:PREDICTED: testis-expressed sequence 13B protein [Hipposideros armiger]